MEISSPPLPLSPRPLSPLVGEQEEEEEALMETVAFESEETRIITNQAFSKTGKIRRRGGHRGRGKTPVVQENENNSDSGPTYYPLQELQAHHRARAFSTNEPLPTTLRARVHKIRLNWSKEYSDFFRSAGLYRVHEIGYIPIDSALIAALVERWRPETHTFHMRHGEMAVTLQDVAFLLGLPIDGEPICLKTDSVDWREKLVQVLGVTKDEAERAFRGSSTSLIRLSWLTQHFSKLPDGAPPQQVLFYARAYMLSYFGSILFTECTGDSVSAIFLLLFENTDALGSYSWGSAVLAYLYRELCKACRFGTQNIGGPLILLQLWSWSRFHIARPEPRYNGNICDIVAVHNADDTPAIGVIWKNVHEQAHYVSSRGLKEYRDEFDRIREDDISWTPYDERRHLLAPIFVETESLTITTAPLIFFWIVEPYNPDRVMRQFNHHQQIPPPPPRRIEHNDHGLLHRGGGDWPVRHHAYIINWTSRWEGLNLQTPPPSYDPGTHEEYMRWYSNNTSLFLQTSREPATTVGYRPSEPNSRRAAEKIWSIARRAGKLFTEAFSTPEATLRKNVRSAGLSFLRDCQGALEDIGECTYRDDTFALVNQRSENEDEDEEEQEGDEENEVSVSQLTQTERGESQLVHHAQREEGQHARYRKRGRPN